MSKAEILSTSVWEMADMISALAIFNGNAKEKIRKKWTFDEAMSLR